MKVEQRCTTPRCVADIAKYGENYHSMHAISTGSGPAFLPSATAKCERCGGYYAGELVAHVCKTCGATVPPGELVGLFVPHNCRDCQDKLRAQQRAAGRVCQRCGNVHAECYC